MAPDKPERADLKYYSFVDDIVVDDGGNYQDSAVMSEAEVDKEHHSDDNKGIKISKKDYDYD